MITALSEVCGASLVLRTATRILPPLRQSRAFAGGPGEVVGALNTLTTVSVIVSESEAVRTLGDTRLATSLIESASELARGCEDILAATSAIVRASVVDLGCAAVWLQHRR
jgi:hypothetical protein